jgi:hypothetical protein
MMSSRVKVEVTMGASAPGALDLHGPERLSTRSATMALIGGMGATMPVPQLGADERARQPRTLSPPLGRPAARQGGFTRRAAESRAFEKVVERLADQRLNRGALLQSQQFQGVCHRRIKMAAHPNRADP